MVAFLKPDAFWLILANLLLGLITLSRFLFSPSSKIFAFVPGVRGKSLLCPTTTCQASRILVLRF